MFYFGLEAYAESEIGQNACGEQLELFYSFIRYMFAGNTKIVVTG